MSGVRSAVEGLIVAVFVALVGMVYIQHQRIERLQAANESASAMIAGYRTKDKATVQLVAAKEKKDAEVATVVGNHREWADQPVPDDVADLLRKH
ncbi:i-spanin [Stenotrophomonas phage Stm18]